MLKEINHLLGRGDIEKQIKSILSAFSEECNNPTFKKGIYIYGAPGSGKTAFIVNILNEMNYDIIKYDAGDVRNKSLIETITHNNISSYNVLQQMRGKPKKIAIVMDEIDGMNNGDKGGITSLIKLIRQKKTKKQKLENKTMNPIICIGNYFMDKKIKELMKVSNVFELKTPTNEQIHLIFKEKMNYYTDNNKSKIEDISNGIYQFSQNMKLNIKTENEITKEIDFISQNDDDSNKYRNSLYSYINGDLRKVEFICKIIKTSPEIITSETIQNIFQYKNYNENIKCITQNLFNNNRELKEHSNFMNDTERTSVALLWHENIIDYLNFVPAEQQVSFYLKLLKNMCFADYMDRITFQNQIWEFNEMTSLIKTFHNNKLFHEELEKKMKTLSNDEIIIHPKSEIRFTKVLTKYSTEYNNQLFIVNLCQELDMDKKDMFSFFQELRIDDNNLENREISAEFIYKLTPIFEKYNINKLDIKRIYKYLDKNIKKTSVEEENESENNDE